jgi:hypothetical protein
VEIGPEIITAQGQDLHLFSTIIKYFITARLTPARISPDRKPGQVADRINFPVKLVADRTDKHLEGGSSEFHGKGIIRKTGKGGEGSKRNGLAWVPLSSRMKRLTSRRKKWLLSLITTCLP